MKRKADYLEDYLQDYFDERDFLREKDFRRYEELAENDENAGHTKKKIRQGDRATSFSG